MNDVRSNSEIWGKPFPQGGEWDAGVSPPRPGVRSGRWTARLAETQWEVIFHPFDGSPEERLAVFPPTEGGELQAKALALRKMREAWGGVEQA